MKINGITIDKSKLISKQELLNFLKENGESYGELSRICERYYHEFGNELIWHYPISDGVHAGVFITAVQEGFLSLPYNAIDTEEYELFEIEHASIFDEDALVYFIDNWKSFSHDLLSAMTDMLRIVREK